MYNLYVIYFKLLKIINFIRIVLTLHINIVFKVLWVNTTIIINAKVYHFRMIVLYFSKLKIYFKTVNT